MQIRPRSGFTLMELLVVIAIIGILAGLLFPAVNGAMQSAKKAQSKNAAVQIATAVTAYETEYGRLPLPEGNNGNAAELTTPIINALMGQNSSGLNPRRIPFLDAPDAKGGKNGFTNNSYYDSWGNPFYIAMDGNYDNSLSDITAGGKPFNALRKKVAVWNNANSTDKKSPLFTNNSVTSW